jgi:hypothetical protein
MRKCRERQRMDRCSFLVNRFALLVLFGIVIRRDRIIEARFSSNYTSSPQSQGHQRLNAEVPRYIPLPALGELIRSNQSPSRPLPSALLSNEISPIRPPQGGHELARLRGLCSTKWSLGIHLLQHRQGHCNFLLNAVILTMNSTCMSCTLSAFCKALWWVSSAGVSAGREQWISSNSVS